MCGLGGILRITPPGDPDGFADHPPTAIPETWLDAIDAHIALRGPDDEGRFRDIVRRADGSVVEVALVHRRLSIIDPATGAQPMVSAGPEEEDLYALVFNGCIYNHRELRRELEARGRVFTSDHSDTEVLLEGYREVMAGARSAKAGLKTFYEEWLPERVDGMYAFALWDRRRGDLVLGRDHFGQKPLYVAQPEKGLLVFASTVPAVRAACAAALGAEHATLTRLDEDELVDWLALGYGAGTPWASVRGVRRGAVVVQGERPLPVEDAGRFPGAVVLLLAMALVFVAIVLVATLLLAAAILLVALVLLAPVPPWLLYRRYLTRRDTQARLRTVIDDVDALLDHAVRARLESDVPLGCFLSGGIDSSLIAHHAQRALGSDAALLTLCVKMPDPRYDESAQAQAMAERLGTRHVTLEVSDVNAASDLVFLIETLGLPFGDSSILPSYWVSEAARRHVKVALSGDGGDELFYGYDRYRAARWLQPGVRNAWVLPDNLFDRSDPRSRSDRMARLGVAARHKGYTDLVAIFPTPDLRRVARRSSGVLSLSSRFGGAAMARQFDLDAYLPEDLLRKVDTASMACGLEVRCPFLGRDLREVVLTLPPNVLMPEGERKGLLRQVALRHLPAEVVDRPKMGFAIPVGEWFRTDHGGMRGLLEGQLGGKDPFGVAGEALGVKVDACRAMMQEHMEGGRDHSQRLFALLSLSVWSQRVLAHGGA
ncbi:MAG: hypothetical protein KDA21_09440 [Phycisphaerales bacterium]|nr:hypothetical protein [Phycisphaerales bacterium]